VTDAEAIAEARTALGSQLSSLRQAAGYTQRAFASLIPGYSRSTLANVEVGRQQVGRSFWERCDAVLDTGGILAVGWEELETATRERRERTAKEAEGARRATLQASRTAPASAPSRVGRTDSDLAAIRAICQAFRTVDRQVGGGHLYPTVVRYLETEIGPRLVTVSDRENGGIFCAAVSLTDMAGWLAHDIGDDELAHRHFGRALRLAKATGNTALTVNVMASMSHLALHRHKPAQAVRLARAGREQLCKGTPPPALLARLHAMEARGLAKCRETTACHQALNDAERTLNHATDTEPAPWLGHFDEGSMAGEAATCFRQLGDLTEAEHRAERVMALRNGDQARSRAFGQLILAGIHIERGELERACAVGHQVLRATQGMESARVTERLLELRQPLLPQRDVGVVQEFLEAIAATRLPGVAAFNPTRSPGT
jgi:hypothetical protein